MTSEDAGQSTVQDAELLLRRLRDFETREAERMRAAEASRLLAEISSAFLAGGSFDKVVNQALNHCGRFVQGDRLRIYRSIDDGRLFRVTHEWLAEEVSAAAQAGHPPDIEASKLGQALAQYREGKSVAIADVRTIHADIREHLERQGIKSSMTFPIFVNGAFHGFCAVHALREMRPWSSADVSILRQACELIGRGLERRLADEKVRESMRQIERVRREQEAILRSTPHGMCLLTANWRIVWCNRPLRQLFSTARATSVDLTGASLELLFRSKADFEEYARDALQTLRGSGASLRRCQLVRADGSPFWCEISIVRHDPNASNSGIVATLTDVTERVVAEKALLDSERRFRSLAQNAADLVIVCGADGRVGYINPAIEHIAGHKPDELIGSALVDLVEDEDAPSVRAAFAEKLPPPGDGLHLEFRIGTADGRDWRLLQAVLTNLLADPTVGGIIINARDVTEARRAERALRDSEALYESLVEGLTQNIFRKDRKGRFTYANNRFCETMGKPRDEILRRTDFDFFPEELAAKYCADDEEVVRDRAPKELIEDHTDAEGRRRVVQVVKTPILDADGDVVGLQGIFWDITERELAADALRVSEERYRDFVDNLPMGIYRMTPGKDGRIIAANPAMAEMFGAGGVAELMSLRATDFFASQRDRELLGARLYADHEVADTEIRLRRVDGSFFWGRASMRAHVNIAGEVEHYDGVMRDITQLKESEEALRLSEERFKSVVENITDGIYEVDLSGNLRYANPGLFEMLGYERGEMVGVNNRQYMDHENARKVFEAFNDVFLTGQPHRGLVYELTAKDGSTRPVEGSISLVHDSRGLASGFRGVVRDISERKAAEQALAEKTRMLERLNHDLLRKNAELDEFTYIASHDLQEPLRKLIAFSEFLRKDMGSDLNDRAAKDVRFIVEAAQRMQNLVQDLLQLSRAGKSAMKRELIEIDECVARALDALAVRVESTKAVIRRDRMPKVWGDRTMLTQLFQNLIGNALKFTGESAPEIAITAELLGDHWILGVKDNGIGLKPEYAEQIFAPFKRLHGRDKYDGSGIGLSICRKSVERHGGKIWVESLPGEGAHFKFTIGARQSERGEDAGGGEP